MTSAYTNINEELSEVCQAMRKIILRELTVYFEDNQADAFRFFETLDVLRLIEVSISKRVIKIMLTLSESRAQVSRRD